jgi:phosphotransferase system enzyme I (PtsI)
MIGQTDEIRRANALLEECKRELTERQVPYCHDIEVGSMIELPAAALIADQLAKEVKFLSVGTNDLVQYAMAVDRGNERIAHLYQPTHPAILRLLAMAARAAHENGIWIGVCGEMASEIHLTPLLLGLGMDELSVVTAAVPRIKKAVQSLDAKECGEMACKASGMTDPQAIDDYCRRYARQHYPELLDV